MRSDNIKKGIERAPNRSLLYALGLTDEEMKENDLYCRYRYKEKIVKHPEGYKGWMEHESGFNI